MQLFFIILLAALLAFFFLRWLILRGEIRSMARAVRRTRGVETNRRITVSSRDRNLASLATAVNSLFDDIHRQRTDHAHAVAKLRTSMADISHDLRTPLTSILGYERLLRSGDLPAGEAERYLSVIRSKAEYLNGLIASLFELARLESGAYPFTLELLDAGEILSEELAGFYDSFTQEGEEPLVELHPGPLWVVGDRQALTRVFANLLQNMVKHRARGIHIASGAENGWVVFLFSNQALLPPGMEAEDLFRRSVTADTARGRESTGLGLSIVREFVLRMNGEIGADYGEGRLSFRLSWPSARS